MLHNPSVCGNTRVNQDYVGPAVSHPLPPSVKGSRKRPAESKGTQAKEMDLERNYIDILLNIHCSESGNIYVGIKRDVPLQISNESASDIFSYYRPQSENVKCACSVHYTMLSCVPRLGE